MSIVVQRLADITFHYMLRRLFMNEALVFHFIQNFSLFFVFFAAEAVTDLEICHMQTDCRSCITFSQNCSWCDQIVSQLIAFYHPD